MPNKAIAISQTARSSTGSMLVLSCMLGILIVIGLLVVYDLLSVYINRQLLTDRADRMALEAASKFNEGDRASRMNHLLVQSRELIFRSRQNLESTANNQPFNHLGPLAFQVLDESRRGAELLERERQRLVAVRLAEVKKCLNGDTGSAAGQFFMGNVSVDSIDVGTISGYSSGVSSLRSNQELRGDDLGQHYIDKSTGLYLGEIDARLPDKDADLPFKLCSLPGVAKQGALQRAAAFKTYAALLKKGTDLPVRVEQMPAAVRLQIHASYTGMLIKQQYELSASAMATGAGPAFQ